MSVTESKAVAAAGYRSRLSSCHRLALLLALLFSGCTSERPPMHDTAGFRVVPAQFDLGDDTRYEFDIRVTASDGKNRLLIGYARIERRSQRVAGEFSGYQMMRVGVLVRSGVCLRRRARYRL